MGDIINLRRVRKVKKRADDANTAATNRLQFGRSKPEKQAQKAEDARRKAQLDGHELESED